MMTGGVTEGLRTERGEKVSESMMGKQDGSTGNGR